MGLRLCAGTAVLALAAAIPAFAQIPPDTSVTLSPNIAGKGSRASVSASGGAATSGNEVPSAASLFVERGFKFDRRAVKRLCEDGGTCPSESRIGSGQAVATASGVLLGPTPRRFAVTIEAFLAPPRAGEISGLVLRAREPSTGLDQRLRGSVRRRTGRFGYEVRLSDFPRPPAVPGVSVRLESLRFEVGTKRRVRERRRGGRRTRLVTRHLVTNPPRCSDGNWGARLALTVPSGTHTRDVSATCRAR